MKYEFEVRPPDAGRRVDRFVQSALGAVPTSLVRRLIRQKKVRVNGARASADQRLRPGDTVVVHHTPRHSDLPAPARTAVARRFAGDEPLVLLHHRDFLFLHKPAGVACSDDGRDLRALPLWLCERFAGPIERGEMRPEPCHRLDRGTTGVVVVALTAAAHDRFRRASEKGQVLKEYEVAVWGKPEASLICQIALRRLPNVASDEPRMVPAEPSTPESERRPARTDFERLALGDGCALLRARLVTGRTHQIRAHCLATGHPVIGDRRYGDPPRDRAACIGERGRPLLHAARLVLGIEDGPLEARASWPLADRVTLSSLGLRSLHDSLDAP